MRRKISDVVRSAQAGMAESVCRCLFIDNIKAGAQLYKLGSGRVRHY